MKVENNIKVNYAANRFGANKYSYNPQFTGISTTATLRSSEEILKDILPDKRALNFINKFEKLRGELGGIIITAIGTGLVAPFSIAFNPFTKAKPDATEEEKEELSKTKKYTAMRQPISAVLAAFFQAGAIGPIDRFLDKISNEQEFAKNFWLQLDQSTIQKKEYIERMIKKEMKKDPATANLGKKEFKDELDRRVKVKQNEQLNKVAKSLEETGQIKVGSRTIPDSEVAEYINHQINEYVKDANALKIDEHGLIFYYKRSKTLMKNKDLINSVLSEEKLSSFKNNPREIKNYLLSLRDKPEYLSIQKILDEIIAAPDEIRESRCFRTIDRIKRIEEICGGHFTPAKYLEVLAERNNILDAKIAQLENCKVTNIQNATKKEIKDAINDLIKNCLYDTNDNIVKDIYENTNTFQNDAEKLGAKIRKDIAKRYKEILGNRYKGFSQISKVIIGVCITLPITCTALNWVYPRFMDIFFPDLAGSKKQADAKKNGGDK